MVEFMRSRGSRVSGFDVHIVTSIRVGPAHINHLFSRLMFSQFQTIADESVRPGSAAIRMIPSEDRNAMLMYDYKRIRAAHIGYRNNLEPMRGSFIPSFVVLEPTE